MRNLNLWVMAGAIYLFSGSASANDSPFLHSGNYWITKCSPASSANSADCAYFLSGLVKGSVGQAALSGAKQVFCAPEAMTNQQAVDVFYQYLSKNPTLRHYDASVIAFKAFADAFPCKK